MRPVSSSWEDGIASSHELALRLTVLPDGIEIPTVLGGSVTLDGQAATRARGTFTIGESPDVDLIPTDPDSLLAPYGNELRVERGLSYPDGTTEMVSIAVLRISAADTDDTGEGVVITVEALDRSDIIIDARFEHPYQLAAGSDLVAALQDDIEAIYPDVTFNMSTVLSSTTQLSKEEEEDRWAFWQDAASALGHSLYFDGDGILTMTPIAPLGAEPVAYLVEGEAGVLLGAKRSWNRDSPTGDRAFNRVIAVGESPKLTGTPPRAVATDDDVHSPTFYYGRFGRVPRWYRSEFITTIDQAEAAAQGILAGELGTTQEINFQSVVNPALEPGDVIRITRSRAEIDEDHVIDELTIPLAADESMTGRTRKIAAFG